MRVEFDFNYEAHIVGVAVEAPTKQEATCKLLGMELGELLENGACVKNREFTCIDSKVTEVNYKVRVFNIQYENPALASVSPSETIIVLPYVNPEISNEDLVEEINICIPFVGVVDFQYEIIAEF